MSRKLASGAAALAIVSATVAAPTAAATPSTFSAVAELNAGYDTNAYLTDDAEGSGLIGLSISPNLTLLGPTSTTTFSGRANRIEYTDRDGHSEYYSAGVSHSAQFSATLSGQASANFYDATSALLTPEESDIISSGQRTQGFGASGGLTWQQDARSSWSASGNAQRSRYPGSEQLGDLTSYGGSLGYSRVLSERTTVGFHVGMNATESEIYPDSTVIQPQLTLTQKLNAYWTLNGGVGVIFQRSRYLGTTSRSRNIGVNASLCGTYPRHSLCVEASRDTSASGFGGLRTRDQVNANLSYRLTERSTLSGSAIVAREKSETFDGLTPDLTYADARLRYDRQLNQRLSIGGSASYRLRKYETESTHRGFTASVVLSAKLGRI